MKKIVLISTAVLAVLSLSGCVVSIGNDALNDEDEWQHRQTENSRYINSMALGTNVEAIESDLGDADYIDTFQRQGANFQVLYYRTQHLHSDGRTSRDETTPLVFIDGHLVGWGPTAVDKATR